MLNEDAATKNAQDAAERYAAPEYRRLLENTPIHVLDIPDEYKYMDAELIDLLRQSVGAILGIE